MTPESGKAPQAIPLQYETTIADPARPLFRATMGVGITLGLVHILYMPNVIWWYSEVRQVFGSRAGLRCQCEFALTIAECVTALGVLVISALAMCGRRTGRSWFIVLLVLMLCCTCAVQVAQYELWDVAITSFSASEVPEVSPWVLFRAALAIVGSIVWPTLMLILVTRSILKPLFRRPAIG